jgi:hypothetical protein
VIYNRAPKRGALNIIHHRKSEFYITNTLGALQEREREGGREREGKFRAALPGDVYLQHLLLKYRAANKNLHHQFFLDHLLKTDYFARDDVKISFLGTSSLLHNL